MLHIYAFNEDYTAITHYAVEARETPRSYIIDFSESLKIPSYIDRCIFKEQLPQVSYKQIVSMTELTLDNIKEIMSLAFKSSIMVSQKHIKREEANIARRSNEIENINSCLGIKESVSFESEEEEDEEKNI